MKIYVTHSTSFDFKKDLYEPIRNSEFNKNNNIALPHEKSTEQFNSKDYMKDCDLVIAEVSYPSTGQGIELGWANLYNVPVVCFFLKGTKPSGALNVITKNIIEYGSPSDLIKKITKFISEAN